MKCIFILEPASKIILSLVLLLSPSRFPQILLTSTTLQPLQIAPYLHPHCEGLIFPSGMASPMVVVPNRSIISHFINAVISPLIWQSRFSPCFIFSSVLLLRVPLSHLMASPRLAMPLYPFTNFLFIALLGTSTWHARGLPCFLFPYSLLVLHAVPFHHCKRNDCNALSFFGPLPFSIFFIMTWRPPSPPRSVANRLTIIMQSSVMNKTRQMLSKT